MASTVLLEVAGEGGSLILAREPDGSYSVRLADQTLTFIEEGDEIRRSAAGLTWDSAVRLLGRYPWHKLSPLAVAPEARDLIWAQLGERWSDIRWPHKRERWAELCGRPANETPAP